MPVNSGRAIEMIFNTKPDGVRSVGRPKLRWEVGVGQDMRILGVKIWKKSPRQRQMGRASLEGRGPPRAVEPVMMMNS